MRRFIVGFFAIIGVLVCLVIAVTIGIAYWASPTTPSVPAATLLSLNLNQSFPEAPPSDAVSRILGEEQLTTRDVLDALERGAADPRVKGLFARMGNDGISVAQVQELRDAIAAFRATGKFAIAYADTFGEFGPGTHAYYLATAFDEIWLQPQGLVGLTGLRSETPFLRGLLDKLDVVPSFDHRSEYKSAMNSITETAMTPAQREESEELVTSIYGQIAHGVAQGRKLGEAQMRDLIGRGPLLTDEAVAAHLIDHVGYRDEAEAAARTRAGSGAEVLSPGSYLDRAGHPHQSGPIVALIYGTGLIQRGSSGGNPVTGGGFMGADSMVRAFDDAAKSGDVRAILFRIDSPGGSAIASETIWRAVQHARDRGKPVVVTMASVAGSGGYYVAAPADKIVAEPATLTGSIGVFAGKFVTAGLWQKLGVGWDAVGAGDNAAMFSSMADFSPEAHQRFESFLDAVYGGFKDRVAKGRKLDDDAVEEIAKGRVWTGQDAKTRGLVDALGGFSTALALAKQAAQIPADQDVTLKLYPHPETTRELVTRLLGRGAPDDEAGTATFGGLAQSVQALRATARQLELASQPPGSLTMAPAKAP
jgi:protease-4